MLKKHQITALILTVLLLGSLTGCSLLFPKKPDSRPEPVEPPETSIAPEPELPHPERELEPERELSHPQRELPHPQRELHPGRDLDPLRELDP